MPEFQTATLIKHDHPASTFHILTLETDQAEFKFQPGQFISIQVTDHQIKNYSLASLPNGPQFELVVDTKPGHEGSFFMHELQVGEEIKFLGPFGNFQVHMDDGASENIFLATGSGIAPVKVMIEHLLYRVKDGVPLKLYFGLRYCSDIFLHDYFDDLAARFKPFTFTPCLSQPDASWRRDCGHITDLIKQDYLNGGHLAAYLCGNSAMINEALEVLKAIGTPEERIYREAFY